MTKNKSEYAKKFKDPRWQKKRLEILQRDEFTCKICGDAESTLHIHHRNYINGREPWEYPDDYLVTLCEKCHEAEYENLNNVMHDFGLVIRSRFFSNDIQEITNGFINIEMVHAPEVISSAIQYQLTNEKEMTKLVQRYFKYLRKKRERRNGR